MRRQRGLQIESVDLEHAQVGDDAARLVAPAFGEKGHCRRVGLDAKPVGPKQPREGQQERGIVVDEVDSGFDHGWCTVSWPAAQCVTAGQVACQRRAAFGLQRQGEHEDCGAEGSKGKDGWSEQTQPEPSQKAQELKSTGVVGASGGFVFARISPGSGRLRTSRVCRFGSAPG